jgi:hypothetical protein
LSLQLPALSLSIPDSYNPEVLWYYKHRYLESRQIYYKWEAILSSEINSACAIKRNVRVELFYWILASIGTVQMEFNYR